MQRRVFFYLFIPGIIIALLVLGLAVSMIFSKKPPKPQTTSPAPVEMPTPVEIPALVEEEIPPAQLQSALTDEEAPLPTAQAPEVLAPMLPEFQKGMNYVAWTANGYSNVNSTKAMEQMVALGINWVGLVTTWYQDHYHSTEIYPLRDKTPTDESLIFAIRKLRELNFKVMLKPHLDLVDSQGKWRGDIGFENPADWQTWFDSYTAFILHYVDIAAKENVELFCVGTELTNATNTQAEHWRGLIKKVRDIYKGRLTYAANWDNEFKQISFWDALDYAGIDPYFPLVTSARPTAEQLKEAWGDWVKIIEEWQKNINKPVILTEIGYKSARDAADEPWQHTAIGELDLEIQVNLYKGLLESFWDKPWFYGVYWWYWGTNPKMGGELNRGFTPQNKPAQEVIKEWYSKSVSEKAY